MRRGLVSQRRYSPRAAPTCKAALHWQVNAAFESTHERLSMHGDNNSPNVG